MQKRRQIRRLSKQLMSKKIFRLILDDFSMFGSLPFYFLVTISAYFIGNTELFLRLLYCFMLSFLVVLVIKSVHYKDRPQKEEFTIFMEKVIASSFPSTHSMNITILTILLSLAHPYLWLIITFIVLSIIIYTQRYVTKKHFLIDIIGGILIAVIEAIFVIRVL